MNVSNPGQQPTRELWVPCTYTDAGGGLAQDQSHVIGWSVAVGNSNIAEFVVPYDFNTILAAVMRCKGVVNDAALTVNRYATYGAPGQSHIVHNEQELTGTWVTVVNEVFEVDMLAVLGDIEADDQVGVRLAMRGAGDDFYSYGFRLRYL